MAFFHRKIKNWSFLSNSHVILILLICAVILWTIGLGNVPLRDWDEATRALVAREIYRKNNWLYLTLNDQPYMLKPPLMIWLVALSYKLGGVSEFTSRFLPAIITAFSVPLMYLIGNEMFAQKHICSTNIKVVSLFSALVYLTLLPVVRHGRLAMMDGMIVTFFLISIYCLLKYKANKKFGLGVGIGLACIALTKGILVLLLGFILTIFILVNRDWKLLKSFYLWLGLSLGFILVFAWYLLQYQEYGDTFIQVHFQSQGFDRLSQAVEGNKGSIFYYLIELLKYTIPWLLFLPSGLILSWQNKNKIWGSLILIGFIIYLSTISMMGTKLPWYIFPIYPFFSWAVGVKLTQMWTEKIYPQWLIFVFYLLSILMLAGIIYFMISDPQLSLIIMSLILSLTFALTAWFIQHKNQRFIPTLFIGLYFSLALLMISTSWNWELNETFAAKPVGELINKYTPAQTVIYTSFNYHRPSLDFYSDRQVIPADLNALKKLSKQNNYLLINEDILNQLNLNNYDILGKSENFVLIHSPSINETGLKN